MLTLEQTEAILKDGGILGIEEAKKLIQENAENGKLFREAANNGYLNVVKFFVEAKDHFELTLEEEIKCTNRGAVTQGGLTPLHFASYHGFTDIVKCIIAREGLSVLQGPYVVTPLYCASRQGHLDLVKLLMSDEGCSIRQQIDAINIAAYKGQLEVTQFLFAAGVPADEAMSYAAGWGHEDIVRFLLLNNVRPDQLAEKQSSFQLSDGGHLGLYEVILQENRLLSSCVKEDKSTLLNDSQREGCGFSGGLSDVDDDTPLHLATEGGHISIVKLILEANAFVNVKDRFGYTPLDTAVQEGDWSIAVLLQSYGGVLNKCGKLLKLALEKGRFLAVLSLQAMGTDLNFFQETEQSLLGNQAPAPLHIATVNNRINIVQYLLQCNVLVDARDKMAVTALQYACAGGHSEIVNLLVDRGASVNTKNRRGECPLSLSLMRGSTALVRYLLENDACPNMRCNEDESGPLHGYHFCNEELPKLYVDGEDYDMVDMGAFFDWTPLHRATLINNIGAAKLLIDFGAEVNAINHKGRTPLHNVQSVELAELLLENEADPLIQDFRRSTPLLCAKDNRRYDIVSVLERHTTKEQYN